MKIVGLVTEYNPFHNGHLYHLEKAKEISGADYAVVVMSGDFVQRGAPAICPKHLRARMALSSGADLVLELPSIYATSSAEDFAAGAIALLDQLGVVDSICFGSECGDIKKLESVADILVKESGEYTCHLREFLKQGLSYPVARQRAVAALVPDGAALSQLLDSPNNILGIEYLKAIKKRGSSMVPYTILRMDKGYHDTSLGNEFGSATAIRQALVLNSSHDALKPLMPESTWNVLSSQTAIHTNDFSALLNYKLLSCSMQNEVLSEYMDISPELEDRIRHMCLDFVPFEERITKLKTKQYTYTRISRGLLHLLLGMKKEALIQQKEKDFLSYARVLGFWRTSAPLLSAIKSNAALPLVTKTADAGRYLSPHGTRLLEQDFYCSHIYHSVYQAKTGILLPNEYTQPLVTL